MTTRDRMVVIVVATVVLLIAGWLLLVAPERNQASKLDSEVKAAGGQLASAESQLTSATAAQQRYQAAYASLVRLGKAVPASQEVPSLIYELAHATNEKNVEFASVTAGATGASGSSASPSSASASAASAGFTQMPFTFVFTGNFTDLYHLFNQLNDFAVQTSSGVLRVSGRLLTIQSVQLAPSPDVSNGGSSSNEGQLTGTVTATGYVLPAGQSVTGGATSSGPAGTATQSASVSGTPSQAGPTALVEALP